MTLLHDAGCGCPKGIRRRRFNAALGERHLTNDPGTSLEVATGKLAELAGWPVARHVAGELYPRLVTPQWTGRIIAGLMVVSGSALLSTVNPEWLILPLWTTSWATPLWLGGRISRRRRCTLTGPEDGSGLLKVLARRRGRAIIRTHIDEIPASAMTHPISGALIAEAYELDTETAETAAALAGEYHASLRELLRTARSL